MNITKKIIITDTNIITDLNNANILDKFVKLDNVYISDMVKNDEINKDTGNVNIINNFKEISATDKQIMMMYKIFQVEKGLSLYDIINYIIDDQLDVVAFLKDKKLKNYSERNGVEVIRTLKIIELMSENEVISIYDAINACILLKKNNCTRIPIENIDKLIEKLKKKLLQFA